ncbi:MAG: hypothetical protein H6Q81_178 [Deltaproteobacteria bacterium]|nr:hypothetical protein [Deltaproteobacteria bacterium]
MPVREQQPHPVVGRVNPLGRRSACTPDLLPLPGNLVEQLIDRHAGRAPRGDRDQSDAADIGETPTVGIEHDHVLDNPGPSLLLVPSARPGPSLRRSTFAQPDEIDAHWNEDIVVLRRFEAAGGNAGEMENAVKERGEPVGRLRNAQVGDRDTMLPAETVDPADGIADRHAGACQGLVLVRARSQARAVLSQPTDLGPPVAHRPATGSPRCYPAPNPDIPGSARPIV